MCIDCRHWDAFRFTLTDTARHAMSALPLSVIGPAIRMVPVTLIIILSFPAWLTWPFLSEERRQSVLQMVRILGRWAMGDSTDQRDGDSETATRGSVERKADKPGLDSALCGGVFEGCDELG